MSRQNRLPSNQAHYGKKCPPYLQRFEMRQAVLIAWPVGYCIASWGRQRDEDIAGLRWVHGASIGGTSSHVLRPL